LIILPAFLISGIILLDDFKTPVPSFQSSSKTLSSLPQFFYSTPQFSSKLPPLTFILPQDQLPRSHISLELHTPNQYPNCLTQVLNGSESQVITTACLLILHQYFT